MRASGVLLPVFSLPGRYGIGCFSKHAYAFVDKLAESGQTYWQILPLGPTSYGDSPYQSFSTFAGNPYFIDLENLMEQGLLSEEECNEVDFGDDETRVAYDKLYGGRFSLLRLAFDRSSIQADESYQNFCRDNEYWLNDYALYMAVKNHFNGIAYQDWDGDIRSRDPKAMKHYSELLSGEVEFYQYLQFEFTRQWSRLRAYANEKGVKIIGDIPIYVSADSADVWAHPELFQLDDSRRPSAVAGCPPDGFSATGQLWGNPLYNWDVNKETGYDWWIRRIQKCTEMYDVIRIDHFRGFDEYFSIPAADETAAGGHWEKGPGIDLFNAIKESLGEISIIAEDLGYITDSVRKLVKDTGFPNMKVLEFAFDSRDSSGPIEYLPHNYGKNHVVYTGTHDNETLMEWLNNILPEEKTMVQDYLGQYPEDDEILADAIIRMAQRCTADTCIIPIQDYLHLNKEARINTPSVVGVNWKWRIKEEQLSADLFELILNYTSIYGRKAK